MNTRSVVWTQMLESHYASRKATLHLGRLQRQRFRVDMVQGVFGASGVGVLVFQGPPMFATMLGAVVAVVVVYATAMDLRGRIETASTLANEYQALHHQWRRLWAYVEPGRAIDPAVLEPLMALRAAFDADWRRIGEDAGIDEAAVHQVEVAHGLA